MIEAQGHELGPVLERPALPGHLTEARARALLARINLGDESPWRQVRRPFCVTIDWDHAAGLCWVRTMWVHDLPDALSPMENCRPMAQLAWLISMLRDERDLLWAIYQVLRVMVEHEIEHWWQLDGVPLLDPVAGEWGTVADRVAQHPPHDWLPGLAVRLATVVPPPTKPPAPVVTSGWEVFKLEVSP